jgi:hypothetical protein
LPCGMCPFVICRRSASPAPSAPSCRDPRGAGSGSEVHSPCVDRSPCGSRRPGLCPQGPPPHSGPPQGSSDSESEARGVRPGPPTPACSCGSPRLSLSAGDRSRWQEHQPGPRQKQRRVPPLGLVEGDPPPCPPAPLPGLHGECRASPRAPLAVMDLEPVLRRRSFLRQGLHALRGGAIRCCQHLRVQLPRVVPALFLK